MLYGPLLQSRANGDANGDDTNYTSDDDGKNANRCPCGLFVYMTQPFLCVFLRVPLPGVLLNTFKTLDYTILYERSTLGVLAMVVFKLVVVMGVQWSGFLPCCR